MCFISAFVNHALLRKNCRSCSFLFQVLCHGKKQMIHITYETTKLLIRARILNCSTVKNVIFARVMQCA